MAQLTRIKVVLVFRDMNFCSDVRGKLANMDNRYEIYESSLTGNYTSLIMNQSPDVIIMDVTKSDELSDSVIMNLSGDSDMKHIPLIFLLSSRNDEVIEGMTQMFSRDFMKKPIDYDKLDEKIKKLASENQ
ncbi:MAG: hypothetical protein ACLFPQ_01840 [Candidatus Woesearchaeota archaeon]